MSCYPVVEEITAICADFLVERRGFGFNGLITLSVNVVLKLTNCELLIANYAFDQIAN